MASKPQIQSRVEPDTKTKLDRYAGEDMTQSEAVRQLVRRQLDAEGYRVAATDGGATVTDRLAGLERQQQQASRTHTATLVVGMAYVMISVATGLSGLWWGVLGIVALLAVVAATVARNRGGEA